MDIKAIIKIVKIIPYLNGGDLVRAVCVDAKEA